ncbi:MAG: hypothetical protein H6618_03275 [Deltaproteobacteria bacterium]|nr:hypothetical protein [Deltaproteobacteria bacterium]
MKKEPVSFGMMSLCAYISALICGAFWVWMEHQFVREDVFSREFSGALADTKVRLVEGVREAQERIGTMSISPSGWDAKVLQSMLELSHSPGYIDQIGLFDQSCRSLVRVRSEHKPLVPCEGLLPEHSDQLHIFEIPETDRTVLAFVTPLMLSDSSEALKLAAFTILDQDWLRTYSQLSAAGNIAGLRMFRPLHESFVSADRLSLSGMDFPLYRTGPGSVLAGMTGRSFVNFVPVMAFCFFFVAVAFQLLGLIRERKRADRQNQMKSELCDWSEHLSRHLSSLPGQRSLPALLELDPQLREHCERLLHRLDQQQSDLAAAIRGSDLVRKTEEQLRQENQFLVRQLGYVCEGVALRHQILKSASFADAMLREGWGELRQLRASLRQGGRHELAEFIKIVMEWQRGFQEKGSRKFLRSLCETPGHQGYQHQLDEQLSYLIQTGKALQERLLSARPAMQSASRVMIQTLRLLSHWNFLALNELHGSDDYGKGGGFRVGDACTEVAALLKARRIGADVRLVCLPEARQTELPDVPRHVFIASLQILILTFTEGKEDEPILFRMSCRRIRERQFAMLHPIRNPGAGLSDPRNHPGDFALACQILRPWGFECKSVPEADGGCFLMLSWPLAEQEGEADPRQKSVSAPGLSGSI